MLGRGSLRLAGNRKEGEHKTAKMKGCACGKQKMCTFAGEKKFYDQPKLNAI